MIEFLSNNASLPDYDWEDRPMVLVFNTIKNSKDCQRCVNLPIVNYTGHVLWGDGVLERAYGANHLFHLFPTPGVYHVYLFGKCDRFLRAPATEQSSLESVHQWGGLNVGLYGDDVLNPGTSGLLATRKEFEINAADTPSFQHEYSGIGMLEQAMIKKADLSKWDVSKLSNFDRFFKETVLFNSPGISSWDVSNMETARKMFFNQITITDPISHWNIHKLVHADQMLAGSVIKNQSRSRWKIDNLKTNLHTAFGG